LKGFIEESEKFHKNVLKLDCETEIKQICDFIKEQTLILRRDGVVLGHSGGIDSALCAELCVRALGKNRVLGLILPEKESSPLSKEYAVKHCQKLAIETIIQNITPTLEAFGTYRKRDEVIKTIFPEYNSNYKLKISLPPDLLSNDSMNFYRLTIQNDQGTQKTKRLNKDELKNIFAAVNSKQRTRMINLYYYAEKMNYLVCGTTNRTEFIQGFFVKFGDGGVDIEPIAHLYKTQVVQLAKYMNVMEDIIHRIPTADTYSLDVSDQEIYFRVPYEKLDLLLYAWGKKIPINEICEVMNLNEKQVKRALKDIERKHNLTDHLRKSPPSLLNSNFQE